MSISILMSIYNGDDPKYLRESLESIKIQTKKPDLIVLVEDGKISKELEKIINYYKDIWKEKLIIVGYKNNRGLAIALNYGLKYCKTDYIARMDSDDVMERDRLEKQHNYLEHHKDIDVVGSWIKEIDELGKEIKTVKYPENHNACRKYFKFRDCFAHPAVMFRHRFFEKVGLYSESHVGINKNEDTNLWFRGFISGMKYANIQEPLLKYRRTKEFYKRRVGFRRAILMARDRIIINKEMKYGFDAYLGIILRLILNILPKKILALLYQIR